MLTMSEDHDTALTALRDGASGLPRQGCRAGAGRARPAHRGRRRRRARPGAGRRRHRAGPGPTVGRRLDRSRSSPTASSTSSSSLAEGLDNHTIARRLVLSPKTVRNHVSNVFAKIQATDRPQRHRPRPPRSASAPDRRPSDGPFGRSTRARAGGPAKASTSWRWAPTSGPAIGRWAATQASGVAGRQPVQHQDAHGDRPGPSDAGSAVHEEVLAAVQPSDGVVEERPDARPGRGRAGRGSGTTSARPPSCSCEPAPRSRGSDPPARGAGSGRRSRPAADAGQRGLRVVADDVLAAQPQLARRTPAPEPGPVRRRAQRGQGIPQGRPVSGR